MSSIKVALGDIQKSLPAFLPRSTDANGVVCEPNPVEVRFVGRGSLASCYAVTEFACAAVTSAAVELSRYVHARGGDAGDLTLDRRLCSLWFDLSTKSVDWEYPSIWDALAGDYRCVDGWIRLHTNSPAHRACALAVLECESTPESVAAAVSSYSGLELESKIVAAGGCAAFMMTREQWQQHPQGKAVSSEPLVAWSTIEGDKTRSSDRVSIDAAGVDHTRPLAGLKVLDLTRVLAGPACTRFLAAFGADVLRIDPPDWDEFLATVEMSVGKRRAGLDLNNAADFARLKKLISEADVLVHGYRSDALERIGLGNNVRTAINPNMIDVALCAYGWSGPWAQRRGFDSLVQMSSGIAAAGMRQKQADRPVPLPVQALDHATGYLMAASVLNALGHRQVTGEIRRARLSLARSAELLVPLQADTVDDVISVADDADYAPILEDTCWGKLARLNFPVCFGNLESNFAIPAGELRVNSAQWST